MNAILSKTTNNLLPGYDSLAHFVVLGLTLFLSSQILSTITLTALASDGVRILLLLAVLILGIVQATLIINDGYQASMVHTLSWILVLPLIVYLFQSNLNGVGDGVFNLWLLLMILGGSFQALFLSKQQPIAIQAFYGLLAAGVLMEVYQASQSTLSTERKALTIALFLIWLTQALPFLFQSIHAEVSWAITDSLGVLFFVYFLLYQQ